MRILIIGAGLEGSCSAWYLARAGHQITLIERREGPALETSHANGGQISVSHPEPWANPRAPGQILRWLGREDAPLLFRLPAEWARWRWGLAFLRECTPWRTRRNTEAIARLAAFSLQQLKALRAETGIAYDLEERGILHLFFDAAEQSRGPERAAQLKRCGLRAEAVSRERCIELEPALAACEDSLHGGLYGIDDESGDACRFADALNDQLAALGVEHLYSTEVVRLEASSGRFKGLHVLDKEGRSGFLGADACVLAAGPWSTPLAATLSIRLPIYPVKGYSVTLPVIDAARAPHVSLTDETRRIVCSRLGDRLRIAGTAELNGYDQGPNPARTRALLDWVEKHLPGASDTNRAELWNGLRPTTPDNIPLIGQSRVQGLWFNTGHGTLGWTLACGSACALASLMDGKEAGVAAFPFLR
jgi:D-amino-acid dehydrogenase